jgi:anti-sigma factor ChrR (cupin superfamily)
MSNRNHQHQHIRADDVEWRQGSDTRIQYARFRMDESNPSSPTMILSKFQPGVHVHAHTHDCSYFEYIIEGEQTVGKQTFGTGDVRLVKGGVGYGPIVIGPNGCTVLIVFEDGSRSMMESLPRKQVTGAA